MRMDVAAAEAGTSLPGIRLRNRAKQVMPNQKKVKARRKRRKELVLIQICLFGGLLLVVKGFSSLAENSGEKSAFAEFALSDTAFSFTSSTCLPFISSPFPHLTQNLNTASRKL